MNIVVLIRHICRKPPANVILNSESECFPSKIRNKAGMTILTTFIRYYTGDISQ